MICLHRINLLCAVITLILNRFPLIQSHAAPDFNDLVREVVRGRFQDVSSDFIQGVGKQILADRLASIFKPENIPFLADLGKSSKVEVKDSIKESPSNVLSKEESNDDYKNEAFDKDVDPQKFLGPIELSATCHSLTPASLEFGFSDSSKGESNKKQCVPLSTCCSRIPTLNFDDNSFCELDGSSKSIGICCSESIESEEPHNFADIPFYRNNVASRTIKFINQKYHSALTESTKTAVKYMKNLYLSQQKLIKEGNSAKKVIPILEQILPEARDIGDGGLALVETTRAIARNLKGTKTSIKRVPPASVIKTTTGKLFCEAPKLSDCSSTSKRYRTLDGSCNNLEDITIGQVFQPLIRLTKSAYEDGIFSPRFTSKSGSPLPSPRLVSSTIATGISRPSPSLNFAFAAHGQFLTHDLSHVPIYEFGENENASIVCCSPEGRHIQNNDNLHPMCLPIDVSDNDPFYSSFGVKCLGFTRSMISSKSCAVGAAQQMNQVTHWMDLSQVYGPLDRVSESLRETSGGRLKIFKYGESDHLKLDTSCKLKENEGKCAFDTGDRRGNHQLYLTILHTVWQFEHNRVAKILETYHPEWSDEQLFQESRRIVIAEYHHITYNEFLPALVGHKLASRFLLLPKLSGYTKYNPHVDGSVANEHTAAAFRIGHSMIANVFKVISSHKTSSAINVKDGLETPLYMLSHGFQDGLIRGFTRMSMENVDQWVTTELTQHLFKPPNKPYGQDLISINIQRGRDHAIPGYVEVVNSLSEYCGLPLIQSFSDMSQIMSGESVKALESIYTHHEDVDLYIAGLLEKPVDGGIVGPTFGCIIGDQFSRTKFGDRFYYEHGDLPNSLNQEQLQQLRKSSYARILCDNGQQIEMMQPLALRKISGGNRLMKCSNYFAIPNVDLSPWKN